MKLMSRQVFSGGSGEQKDDEREYSISMVSQRRRTMAPIENNYLDRKRARKSQKFETFLKSVSIYVTSLHDVIYSN